MYITFLRHATAVDRSLAMPDALRPLTDKGEKQVKRLAAFCYSNRLIPERIFASPLLRAQQTATLLVESLPHCPAWQEANWLGMGGSVQSILDELAALAAKSVDDVWLVGHEPDFSNTIGTLLQCTGDINIKKASLTRLEANFGAVPSATLLWSIPCSFMP